jgi:hypothetical protein
MFIKISLEDIQNGYFHTFHLILSLHSHGYSELTYPV